MKRFDYLWLIGILMLVPLGFSSCSDSDDDENTGSASTLVGTWESVSYTYQWKEDGEVVDEGTEEDSSIRIRFHEDETCEIAEYYNGKWNWENPGTWKYKNGKITVTDEDGESDTATVKTLTASKLVVEYHEKYTEDGILYEDYDLTEYRKISDQ